MSIESSFFLQSADYRQSLRANFNLIKTSLQEETLWKCGISSKGIVTVLKSDRLIDKIIFLIKELFGYINTSYASMKKLKQELKLIELPELKEKIVKLKDEIREIKEKLGAFEKEHAVAEKELKSLNDQIASKMDEVHGLASELTEKKLALKPLEEKLEGIQKEEELEVQLKIRHAGSQAIIKEIDEIIEGYSAKQAELINRISSTSLGPVGWLANAVQMIEEKKKRIETLFSQIENNEYDYGRHNNYPLTLLRDQLCKLTPRIDFIADVKQYASFLADLEAIEKNGWTETSYGQLQVLPPESIPDLEKNILREVKELVKLTFTRSQMILLRN